MATAQAVAAFLTQVSDRSVTDRLPPDALEQLQQAQLVQLLAPDQIAEVQQRIATLEASQQAIAAETAQRSSAADAMTQDSRKTHSILFHLEGVDAEHAVLERLAQEQSAVRNLDEDLQKRQQEFAELLVQKSLLDMASPYNGGSISITTAGRMALRDLNVRLYRVGDQEFGAYWQQAAQIDAELVGIATHSASLVVPLTGALPDIERGYLWAVAIGMVKSSRAPEELLPLFLHAYGQVSPLSENLENRLMAAEILASLPMSVDRSGVIVAGLVTDLQDMGIADDAALGVASILLLGQRGDGTLATEPLVQFLTKTPSLESAALLAIVNRPFEELVGKFDELRQLYASWGYPASEDTELSAAYLTASELPVDSIGTKISILARGLSGYLQYPLVAASILASIPVLEANETLNLMEKAYGILGQRTGPLSQAEIISLSVRMIHGLQVASVDELDPTARAVAPPPSAAPGFSYVGMPPRLWMPVFIAHNAYYATFSGIGGPHPGHVHGWGGGGWGGGGFVG